MGEGNLVSLEKKRGGFRDALNQALEWSIPMEPPGKARVGLLRLHSNETVQKRRQISNPKMIAERVTTAMAVFFVMDL